MAHRPRAAPLEALLLVADQNSTYLVSGNGDVIEPDEGIGPSAPAGLRAVGGHACFAIPSFPPGTLPNKHGDCRKDLYLHNDNVMYEELE